MVIMKYLHQLNNFNFIIDHISATNLIIIDLATYSIQICNYVTSTKNNTFVFVLFFKIHVLICVYVLYFKHSNDK